LRSRNQIDGQKAKEVEDTDFNLWYTGMDANRIGVDILINKRQVWSGRCQEMWGQDYHGQADI
jgi:hypothetical protein